jgi:hypothetical protein
VQLKAWPFLSTEMQTMDSKLIVPQSHHRIVSNIQGQSFGKHSFDQKAAAIAWPL